MTEKKQTHTIKIDGWTFRIKEPSEKSNHEGIILLLHGHLGNENVMWILTNPLPEGFTLLSPRAPVKLGEDQYSWHEIGTRWPDIDQYKGLTDQLLQRVDSWAKENAPKDSRYNLMGFSQGAVMAYALAICHPERVGRIASIAGFIPQSWKPELTVKGLNNKQFFIAHGTEDDIIPVKKARQAAQWLQEKGAKVTLCTAKTGHKISSNCFNGLGNFFQTNSKSPAANQGNHT